MLNSMSLSELADFELSSGAKLLLVGNTWWREVGPRFFRPLFLFSDSASYVQDLPDKKFCLGYQYPSGENGIGTSFINMLMLEDTRDYTVHSLNSKRRKKLTRAQRKLTVSKIDSLNQLSDDIHEAYVSFYGRTKYGYRKDRLNKDSFTEWIKTVLSHEKIHVAGVYEGTRLGGLQTFCVVDNVLIGLNLFYSQRVMKLGAPEIFFHHVREIASQSENVRKIAIGSSNEGSGINNFYLSRGASVVPIACHLKINTALEISMKMFLSQRYKRLLGA
jgi:hypothetical protein